MTEQELPILSCHALFLVPLAIIKMIVLGFFYLKYNHQNSFSQGNSSQVFRVQLSVFVCVGTLHWSIWCC